jgi:predicted RNA polymerase sigma factor
VFPPLSEFGHPASFSDALLLLALLYRTAYGVLGCHVTARLSPQRPMAHALALASIGFVIGVLGAVATAMVEGPEAGLRRIDTIAQDERLQGHYRLDAVRAHLYERIGQRDRALEHYRRAADGTASLPERNYLLSKAARLGSTPS